MTEINYDINSKMSAGFPKIKKLGAVSPYGEMTPFVFQGRLMRLELVDMPRGLDPYDEGICAVIRDVETGKIVSSFGHGCYYFSGFLDGDVFYVLGTKSKLPKYCGDTIVLFESRDLKTWQSRELLKNTGWEYYNTSLCKGDDGYVLTLEAGAPTEFVGSHPFTCFFATSKDLKTWEFMDYGKGYPKDRYIGGPYMRFWKGYYYLFVVTELPCLRYTNYLYRTKDFDTWEVGFYNPFLMPSQEDRLISPRAADLTKDLLDKIEHGFISNNSDVDMCEWQGKTYINYAVGDQRGFYYMAEAEYDGTVGELLENFFK
jgi:alpha-L-fucosidase